MLEWVTPALQDVSWVTDIVNKSESIGSDVSFANIYLLRNKYDIQICHYKDFMLRHYNGYAGRAGYTFPLGTGDVYKALDKIRLDALERKEKLRFCLLTESQKEQLEEWMPETFAFSSDAGDTDYIYQQTELANLPGKAFHKKKNHVSRFVRMYPDYRFEELGMCNIEDASLVEDAWYNEHLQEEDESQQKEYLAIKEALASYENLSLFGGVLYVNDTPVAMTIASEICENACDVHFEKAIGECVVNGAYAAINKFFAASLKKYEWINREEDIGIEGLRKAKMSYRPKILLKKYNAVEK